MSRHQGVGNSFLPWLKTWTGFEVVYLLMLGAGVTGGLFLGITKGPWQVPLIGVAVLLIIGILTIRPLKSVPSALCIVLALSLVTWQWSYLFKSTVGLAQGYLWLVASMTMGNLVGSWSRSRGKAGPQSKEEAGEVSLDVTTG